MKWDWFTKKKNEFSLNRYRTRVSKLSYTRNFLSEKAVEKIGLIVYTPELNVQSLLDLKAYIKSKEEKGKQVTVIEVVPKGSPSPQFKPGENQLIFSHKHIGVLHFPSVQLIQALNDRKLDLLLNLNLNDEISAHYISGFSNATMRVGPMKDGLSEFYEFQVGGGETIAERIEVYQQYLSVFS